jgi:FkbM family methyltransferase
MSITLQSFLASPMGRAAYRPLQRVLHFARRRSNPEIPLDHSMVEIRCRQKQFLMEVRRWSPSDRQALEQCFRDEQYNLPNGVHSQYLSALYRAIVAQGSKPLIVDCGANIGASVQWFGALYPEAHIVAIEPAPENFALLCKNTRDLDIDLRQAGIGPADSVGWVSDAAGDGMSCRTNESGQGTEIRIFSMETVLASKSVDAYVPFLLKVDIEGAEKLLFAGPCDALNRFAAIVMEPHDWMFPGQQTSSEFFRFHAVSGREFLMMHENVVSIRYERPL